MSTNYIKKYNPVVSNIQKLIDVNSPIIYIDDFDFTRVDTLIAEAVGNTRVEEWCPATGCTNFIYKMPKGQGTDLTLESFLELHYAANHSKHPEPCILVLREISSFINEPRIISLLTHISQRKLYDRSYDTTVIISDIMLSIPPQLMPYVSLVEIEKPDDSEIWDLIQQHLEVNDNNPEDFNDKDREALMPQLRGLSKYEIDRVLDMAMSINGTLGDEDKGRVLQQKKAQVKKSGLIELVEVKESLDTIGGLEVLKQYLRDKSTIMANLAEALNNKVSIPKGVFIVGMPGCGKSLCAKAASAQFNCPLLKLDMGSMMGKYVGQSEENLRKAIKIAEAAAPCILWIDEIEKAFSGVGGSNDIMTRMFGYFLSWMQDKTSSVYVIATANNADNLPPELKRKGRFDEIFCVNLPTSTEREAIIHVHLKKKDQNIPNVSQLVNKTDGYNGADIESVVNDALQDRFVHLMSLPKEKRSGNRIILTEEDLLKAASKTVCISKSCKSQIDKMAQVFKESNFTNASKT